jgi:hypothetical protein
VIEHLPQELRDRFTEMREMDLSVQSKLINQFMETFPEANSVIFQVHVDIKRMYRKHFFRRQ